jgi:hypothetical protein
MVNIDRPAVGINGWAGDEGGAMTTVTKGLCAIALAAAALSAIPAAAHGVRWSVGIGVPLFSPWYYPAPYYYPYPAPVVVQQQQPVYVESAPAPQAAPAEQFWYYCPDSKTYYPYVKSCSSAWQRVRPQPPGT